MTVKTLKATGAGYLPLHDFAANAAWLELALPAHDVMVFTQLLTLDGEHQTGSPSDCATGSCTSQGS
jgi:hypothetical protein